MILLCKCCGGAANHLGSVDFNKSCWDRMGPRVFPVSGTMVPYYSCPNCGFIFTDFMDNWSREDFVAKVYNDDYHLADPEQLVPGGTSPPKDTIAYHNGLALAQRLRGSEGAIRILDFGAGGDPGLTGRALIDKGFHVDSYEPNFVEGSPEPVGPYDLIIMIEVIEHCHDLDRVMRQLSSCLAERGMVFVTTGLHPQKHDATVLSSWYIAPRNGHISIFSFAALAVLFRRYGLNMVQTLNGMVAFREKPNFRNDFLI
jgi:2-polyprenyl-6-hydroxyphenyl methylase/3-demethylubiquinone-9 3-methyltransferase